MTEYDSLQGPSLRYCRDVCTQSETFVTCVASYWALYLTIIPGNVKR